MCVYNIYSCVDKELFGEIKYTLHFIDECSKVLHYNYSDKDADGQMLWIFTNKYNYIYRENIAKCTFHFQEIIVDRYLISSVRRD